MVYVADLCQHVVSLHGNNEAVSEEGSRNLRIPDEAIAIEIFVQITAGGVYHEGVAQAYLPREHDLKAQAVV